VKPKGWIKFSATVELMIYTALQTETTTHVNAILYASIFASALCLVPNTHFKIFILVEAL